MGILRSEKRDLGDPGEGFSRDELPKVRIRFRAQTGVAQGFGGSQGGVSVGEEAGERLPQVADGLGLGLVFTGGPTLGGVRRAEAVSQGLGFAETERQGGWGRPGWTPQEVSPGACLEASWVSPITTRTVRPEASIPALTRR